MNQRHLQQLLAHLAEVAKNLAREHGDLAAGYVYGSNVSAFSHDEPLVSEEIDIMLVTQRGLRQGEQPYAVHELEACFSLPPIDDVSFRVITNGVPPACVPSGTILLDIIGDGLPNIAAEDPSSIIVAQKERLVMYGRDVYKPLEGKSLSPTGRLTVFHTMTAYCRREFLGRTDSPAIRAAAKTGLFLASLLDDRALRDPDKRNAVNRIAGEYPVLRDDLSFFLATYFTADVKSSTNMRERFDRYCRVLESCYARLHE